MVTLERRRLQAGRFFAKGVRPGEVARRLGVSRQAASQWQQRWSEYGQGGLKSKRRPGRPAELTMRQKDQLRRALIRGPQAHGWSTNLWTLERIQQLIWRKFGVRYRVGYVWYVVRALDFTAQRPQRRAREHDDEAMRRWLRWKWPAIKKNSNGGGPGW